MSTVSSAPILYRDAIWGDIDWDSEAAQIIDTPEFQRLDRLKQLGFAYLVYRDAKHSRWEHSLGCYHVARRISHEIAQNHRRFGFAHPGARVHPWFSASEGKLEDAVDETLAQQRWRNASEVIGWTALLHDITHVPWGHTLEDELGLYLRHDDLMSPRLYYLLYSKESRLSEAFRSDAQIGRLAPNDVRDFIFLALKFKFPDGGMTKFSQDLQKATEGAEKKGSSLVQESVKKVREVWARLGPQKAGRASQAPFQPFFADLVSNTVCADILDYVRRDARNTGQPTLDYDDRIFRYFVLGQSKVDESWRLALQMVDKRGIVRKDIINEVLNLMRNRFDLTERVIHHKTKGSASALLRRGLQELRKADPGAMPREPGDKGSAPCLLALDDNALLDYLSQKGGPVAEAAVKAIVDRALYKVALIVPKDALVGGEYQADLAEKLRENAKDIEDRLAISLHIEEPGTLPPALIYSPPPGMQAKIVETLIKIEAGTEHAVVLARVSGQWYSTEANELSAKYSEDWRSFLFLRPDLVKLPVVVHRSILNLMHELGWSDLNRAREFAPGFRTPVEVVQGWIKASPFLAEIDPEVIRRIQEASKSLDSWRESPVMLEPIALPAVGKEPTDMLAELLDNWAIRLCLEHHAPALAMGGANAPRIDLILEDPGKLEQVKSMLTDRVSAEAKEESVWVDILRELLRR